MSEMIERAARAICEEIAGASWASVSRDAKRRYRKGAADAILAMREPTQAMWDAGYAECDADKFADGYISMIDAALAEDR